MLTLLDHLSTYAVITHYFNKDFSINYRTCEVAILAHTMLTPIWKNRIISFVDFVYLVDAQGRDFK
jgi:hypothetical protein